MNKKSLVNITTATTLACVLSMQGCATNKQILLPVTPSPVTITPAVTTTPVSSDREAVSPPKPSNISFYEWLAGFRNRLTLSGTKPETVASMLDNLEPDMLIIQRDQSQPEFVRPIWSYLDTAVSDLRVANGQKAYASHRASIDAIAQHYGVRAEILIAIWGLESAYGKSAGDKDIVRSLATLAWEGRRRVWAEQQLIATAQMIDRGFATREQLIGSWAGAMGQTQLIPTTYLETAVDWNGDDRRNIWTDKDDALASAANLLAQAGWQSNAPVIQEVLIPDGFDLKRWDPEHSHPVSEWAKMGINPIDATAWPSDALPRPARLFLPAGRTGPGFLTFPNFEVIRHYNNSSAYILAVSYLAERIAGGGTIIGTWPKDDVPLTRTQTRELQDALNALGYHAGQPDGLAGAATRRALRDFQRTHALDADGYVGSSAFAKVMAAEVSK